MKHVAFMLVAIFIAAHSGQASAQEFPLFDAFKSFCVNTGGHMDSVKSAVEKAAGTQIKPPTSSGGPYPRTDASWSVTVAGHKMTIAASTSHGPYGPGRTADHEECKIDSFAKEDESIAWIQAWVGNVSSQGNSSLMIYNFQEQGGILQPLPSDSEPVQAAGHAWMLIIRRVTDEHVSVHLVHQLNLICANPCPSVPPIPVRAR